MAVYLIVGAGAIGTAAAHLLADDGHEVRLVSRRGTGPAHANITAVAADASDAPRLHGLADGADAILNCANPQYHRWLTDWPPIAASLLGAAERSGAVLATLSNLYAYGPTTAPMTPDAPLSSPLAKAQVRAGMWRDALAAHRDGRLRATEVRASDYIGPRALSVVGERLVPRLLAGKGCQVLGDPDVAHSWSYTIDVASTLIACARRPEAWGRPWHAPTNPPRTQRQVVDDLADAAGVAHVTLSRIPDAALRLAGLFSPVMRELPKTLYQFEHPFILDDSVTRQELGLTPTPWADLLADTVAYYRAGAH
jgi:nucleoside-diphosphate-sugar epimerase